MNAEDKARHCRVEALIQAIVDARKLLSCVHMRCLDNVAHIICRKGPSKRATDLPAAVTCLLCQAILRLPPH